MAAAVTSWVKAKALLTWKSSTTNINIRRKHATGYFSFLKI